MKAEVIDGKRMGAEVRAEVAEGVAELKEKHGVVPGLAVVMVGDDPASAVYVRSKQRAAIEAGTVVDTLCRVPVKKGQCYYLPSGTLHALGAGVLVAEVQTPSDITYRVYDWDRVDPGTGRPRDLH